MGAAGSGLELIDFGRYSLKAILCLYAVKKEHKRKST